MEHLRFTILKEIYTTLEQGANRVNKFKLMCGDRYPRDNRIDIVLQQLETQGFVIKTEDEYDITNSGKDIINFLDEVGRYSLPINPNFGIRR